MGITGRQIRDESLASEDIKNGSIRLEDLAPEVLAEIDRGQVNTNTKNILINSTEIRALKQQDLDQDLTIFVDSFDDSSNIDPASLNFEVDSANGFVELVQGGQLFFTESTEPNFNLGSFINSEAFLDVGGDGAIRKNRSTIGAEVAFPGFPAGLSITLDGQPVPISTEFGTYVEGVESSAPVVDFPDPDTAQNIYEIPFAANIAGFRFIQISYLKRNDSELRYSFELEDSLANTFTFPQRTFTNSQTFQDIKEDLNDVTGINLASIAFFRIIIENDTTDQTILSLGPQNGNNHMEVREDRTIKQTFFLPEDTLAQLLRVRVRWENNEPDAPLDIAIANAFETTLGTGQVKSSDAGNGWSNIYVLLDTPVVLKRDVSYAVLFQSPGSTGTNAWDVARTSNDAFPQFQNFYNGNDTSYNTVVDIVAPPISEPIYFDNFRASQVSTYNTGNEFTSRGINLGLIPSSIDDIRWIEEGGDDNISVRVKFASTESGLTSASWSSFFNNPGGGNTGIAGVTPNQWFQFQVIWSGGSNSQTTIVRELTLDYTVPGGQGNAVVISQAEFTMSEPTKFMFLWEVTEGSGTADFFVSRDGKATWQAVPISSEGVFTSFTGPTGTQIHARVILTGDAKLYSWALGTDKEFI